MTETDTIKLFHRRLAISQVQMMIRELEATRENLTQGELRSAYNGALDRIRVLESKLFEIPVDAEGWQT
jgi:hypothetical protein